MSSTVSDAQKRNKSTEIKRRRVIVSSILIALMILAIVAVAVVHESHNKNKPVVSPTSNASASAMNNTHSPFLKDVPQEQISLQSKSMNNVSTMVSNGVISTSSKNVLKISETSITSSSGSCTVQKDTDFCLAGTTHYKNSDFDIFFIKDAVYSRLFENIQNFEKLSIRNSMGSGVFNLAFQNGNPSTLAIVNKDGSGWMITGTSSNENEILKEMASTIN